MAKFYALMRKRATTEHLSLLDENVVLTIEDQQTASLDGMYVSKHGYLQLVSKKKSMFSERSTKYTIVGSDGKKVIGNVSLVRTFQDGTRFAITVEQTFGVGDDGKIKSILSKTISSKKLAALSGLKLQGEAASIQVCLNIQN